MSNEKIYNLQKGKKLFSSTEDDWWFNAVIHWNRDNSDFYIDGYKTGADLLAKHILEKDRSEEDFLAYPMIFLYRYYIELELKMMIINSNKFLNIKGNFPKGHKIEDLWQKCRGLLEKIFPSLTKEDVDIVEEYIKQLWEEDCNSIAFRYSTDLGGNASLPEIEHINIRNLYEIMQGVCSFLSSCSLDISEYLEIKEEIESEWN